MRADAGLPFLLQFDNIARFENGKVLILDRRVYPARVEFVTCSSYHEVAQAIRDMVTQSLGPYSAAGYGMVLAAYGAKTMSKEKARQEMMHAADVLAHARPTTSAGMKKFIDHILQAVLQALDEGNDILDASQAAVQNWQEQRYLTDKKACQYLVDILPETVRILTQCYADVFIGFTLMLARDAGKKVSIFCPETRPYLQGARLTASVASDLGIPTTVITDNMPGYILSQGMVDAFICAADVITLDGYVVNKVGTYQIALAAHHNNVPFYVTRDPAVTNPTIQTVKIEERDPKETLYAMGVRTAREGVNGYYPAFDITPPNLVSAVVTSKGLFSPYDLKRHFG